MNKIKLSILFVVVASRAFSQSPSYISYQGVARDASGNPIANAPISLRFDLHQGSATGTVVFTEKQENTIRTSSLGLFNTKIGAVTNMSVISWQNGPFYLEVFLDEKGGTNYTSLGTQQLLSVPYALMAQHVPASSSGTVLTIGTGTVGINLPPQVTLSAGQNVALSGGPDYTIDVAPTLSISADNQSLSISGGNTVLLPATNATVTGTGLASVSPSTGLNFSVDVPVPIYNSTTGVMSFGPSNNFTIAPDLSYSGGILRSGPASNTVNIPTAITVSATPGGIVNVSGGPLNYAVTVPHESLSINGTTLSIVGSNNVQLPVAPTVTGSGLAVVTGGPNYTVTVMQPSIGYNQSTGTFSNGALTTQVVPTLGLLGTTTLYVGPTSNSVSIAGAFPWKQSANSVTLATGSDRVGIGTNASSPSAKLDVQGESTLSVPVLKVINSNGANTSAAVDVSSNSGSNPALNVVNTSPGGVAGSFNSSGGYALFAQNNSASFHALYANNSNPGVGGYAGYFAGGLVTQGKNTGSGDFAFLAQNNISTNLLTVRNDGNVGINTNVPTSRLHVSLNNGSFRLIDNAPFNNSVLLGEYVGTSTSGPQQRFQLFGNANWIDIGQNGGGDFVVEGNDIPRMVVQNTGSVGIGVTSPVSRLDISSPGFSLLKLTTTGVNSNVNVDAIPTGNGNLQVSVAGGATNGFAVVTGGTQRMMIDGSGRVGINVSNPTASLHVNGTVRITDGTEGTGKVLTSDVNGNASWQAGSAGWGLTGNAGTTPSLNFIGTNDNKVLNFRINNQPGGLISFGPTFFGYLSGSVNTDAWSSGFGFNALGANSTGVGNTGIGRQALEANTIANYNTAVGFVAMPYNTTGASNAALGSSAGYSNTTGNNNTFLGTNAGVINTTGSNNAFLGYNTNASANNLTNVTAVGANATVTASNKVKLGNAANVEFDLALMPAGNSGTLGQVLQSAGPGAAPVWTTAASGWGLTGNAGTNPATNYIGTTDTNPIVFKINSNQAGKIEINNASTSFGYQSSNSASGGGNAAFGYQSLRSATNGSWNAAFGCNALTNAQNAHYNTAVGMSALINNVNGPGNTGIGYSAMSGNVSGGFNVGVGNLALWSSTGDYNVGIGNQAYGSSGVTGSSNTAVGHQALAASVGSSGSNNAAFGSQALFSISSGSGNVGVGNLAGLSNSTGNNNVFLGSNSNASSGGLSNAAAIGANATVTASNRVKIGNAANVEFDLALMPAGNAGTLGQVLTSQGTGAAPVWTTAASSGWGLTGNAGTSTLTNFIGTTDNVPLNFRVFNQKAGTVDQLLGNVFLGFRAGNNNTTGNDNVAIGQIALQFNTTGFYNVAIGSSGALSNNITGSHNTAINNDALLSNTIGNANTALGKASMHDNTAGSFNTASGYGSLYSNITGGYNTGGGYISLYTNTTGSLNSAFGYQADVISGTLTNASAIGANAKVGLSNAMVLGDTSNVKVGIGTGYPTSKLHVKGAVRIVDGTQSAGKVLTSDASGNASWQANGTSTSNICLLKDVKAPNTDGGTFTSGSWQTRDINTVEGNSALVAMASNQFTLQAGSYLINVSAPACNVGAHQAKLRNITDNTDDILGSTMLCQNGNIINNHSLMNGVITITSAKAFQIQHRCSVTVNTIGFGADSGFGTNEIYTQVQITKLN